VHIALDEARMLGYTPDEIAAALNKELARWLGESENDRNMEV